MKKIILIISIIILCVFCTNSSAMSLNIGDTNDKIIDYTGQTSELGKFKKSSYEIIQDDYLIYKSYWASWQDEIYEKKDSAIYDLYEYSMYIDFMVDEFEKFRIESGQQVEKKFSYTESKTLTQSKSTESSLRLFNSSELRCNLQLGIAVDGLSLKQEENSIFKVESEFKIR